MRDHLRKLVDWLLSPSKVTEQYETMTREEFMKKWNDNLDKMKMH